MVKGPDRNLKPRLQKLFTCVTHWGFTTKISQLKGQAQCKSGLLMWTTTLVIMVMPVTGKYGSCMHSFPIALSFTNNLSQIMVLSL